MTDALTFLVAFALSALLTPLVRAFARKHGIVAAPSRDRWRQRPVALLGGLALIVPFALSTALLARLDATLWALLAGCVLLSSMGLYDDLRGLRPHTKLVGQIIVAVALIATGYQLRVTPSDTINVLLTVLWLVGITNAFNLLDNMDGLSAGIGAIVAGFGWVLCLVSGEPTCATASAALTGTLLGFLIYNFHPATIFMGDCGSLFVGLALGGLIIAHESGALSPHRSIMVLLIPAFVFLIPIFDTTYVTVMRTLWGRKVSQGGSDHTSHRLVSLGLSEPAAVLVLYVLTLVGGGLGLMMRFRGLWTSLAVAPLFVLLLGMLGIYLGKVSVYRDEPVPHNGIAEPTTSLWKSVKYKRRMFEVLLDLVLIAVAYFGAYVLQYEGFLEGARLERLVASLPMVIGAKMAAFWLFGVYRRMWRYTGVDELLVFLKAVAAGSVLSIVVLWVTHRLGGHSRTVFAIDAMLLFLLLSASRVSFKVLDRLVRRQTSRLSASRVLVYGAGDAGELAVREMLNNDELGMQPIGFVDDDPLKRQARIHGLPVLGGVTELEQLLDQHAITAVVVSSQRLNGAPLQHARDVCRQHQVPLKRLSIQFTD